MALLVFELGRKLAVLYSPSFTCSRGCFILKLGAAGRLKQGGQSGDETGRSTIAISALLFGFFFMSTRVQGQTQTTGDIAGTVTDPSGAVVPGGYGFPEGQQQGTTQDTTTNRTGAYHFFLLTSWALRSVGIGERLPDGEPADPGDPRRGGYR